MLLLYIIHVGTKIKTLFTILLFFKSEVFWLTRVFFKVFLFFYLATCLVLFKDMFHFLSYSVLCNIKVLRKIFVTYLVFMFFTFLIFYYISRLIDLPFSYAFLKFIICKFQVKEIVFFLFTEFYCKLTESLEHPPWNQKIPLSNPGWVIPNTSENLCRLTHLLV